MTYPVKANQIGSDIFETTLFLLSVGKEFTMNRDLLKFNFDPWIEYFEISQEASVHSDEPSRSNVSVPTSQVSFCVKCKKCSAIVKVSYSSSCNIKHHLNRKHKDIATDIINRINATNIELKRRRKNVCLDQCSKRIKLNVQQSDLDSMIVSAICSNGLSFSVLNDRSMRLLLESGYPSLKVPSRKSIVQKLDEEFNEMVQAQKSIFESVRYVCLTADAWSSHRRYGLANPPVQTHFLLFSIRNTGALLALRLIG